VFRERVAHLQQRRGPAGAARQRGRLAGGAGGSGSTFATGSGTLFNVTLTSTGVLDLSATSRSSVTKPSRSKRRW